MNLPFGPPIVDEEIRAEFLTKRFGFAIDAALQMCDGMITELEKIEKKGDGMKPIAFEEVTVVAGEGQPEYQELPVHWDQGAEGACTSCWELDENDLRLLQENKVIWLTQYAYNSPLQPVLLQAVKPKLVLARRDAIPVDKVEPEDIEKQITENLQNPNGENGNDKLRLL